MPHVLFGGTLRSWIGDCFDYIRAVFSGGLRAGVSQASVFMLETAIQDSSGRVSRGHTCKFL